MNRLSISKLTSSIISTFVIFNILSLSGCEDTKDNATQNSNLSGGIIFISSEGKSSANDGAISVFKNGEKIQSLLNLGNVVQSILVHENMLFVIISGSGEIKRFDITQNGLTEPGITIDNLNQRLKHTNLHLHTFTTLKILIYTMTLLAGQKGLNM